MNAFERGIEKRLGDLEMRLSGIEKRLGDLEDARKSNVIEVKSETTNLKDAISGLIHG